MKSVFDNKIKTQNSFYFRSFGPSGIPFILTVLIHGGVSGTECDEGSVNKFVNTLSLVARILYNLCTGQGDPSLQEAVCGGGIARTVLSFVVENIRNYISLF